MDHLSFTFTNPNGDHEAIREDSRQYGRLIVERDTGKLACGLRLNPKGTTAWVRVLEPLEFLESMVFAQYIAVELLSTAGITEHGSPLVSRVDYATDVEFSDPTEPQHVLRALTALTPAAHKLVVVHAPGSATIQTVYWKGDTGIRLRVYDRSARTGKRGSVLRFERQDQRRAASRVAVADILKADLSKLVTQPLRLGKAGNLLVADLTGMRTHLAELRDDGTITQTVAERLLGSLVWAREAGPDGWRDARTARLRRRELEDLGIAFHPQLAEPYDLGPVLLAVRQAWMR